MKIYIVENTINDKKYIGVTNDTLNQRLSKHCFGKSPLGRDIRELGKDKFKIKLITEVDVEKKALDLEIEYILKYKTNYPHGYNIQSGGNENFKWFCDDALKKFQFASLAARRKKIYANDILFNSIKEACDFHGLIAKKFPNKLKRKNKEYFWYKNIKFKVLDD